MLERHKAGLKLIRSKTKAQEYLKNNHRYVQYDEESKKTFQLSNLNSHSFAFTLAEVLITLGIIGVVAALTVPVIMNNIQEKEYKTAYKKAYSTLSQAFMRALQENEIVEMTGTYSSQGMESNFNAIKNQFKVIKYCTNSANGCWVRTGEIWRSEDYYTIGFIDSSGMAWKLRNTDAVELAPAILLDTNGSKKPNQYGKDRFPLFLNNSSGNDPWAAASSGIGKPTKISAFLDILSDETDTVRRTMCPSYATHPCYNTTWIME